MDKDKTAESKQGSIEQSGSFPLQSGVICEDAELKKQFGFVKGETPCACCKKILNIKDAHWAFGQWFHGMIKDCHK